MSRVQIAPLIGDLVEFAKIVSTTPVVPALDKSPGALKRRRQAVARRERRIKILRHNVRVHLGASVGQTNGEEEQGAVIDRCVEE